MLHNAIALVTDRRDGKLFGRLLDPWFDDGFGPAAPILFRGYPSDRSQPLFLAASEIEDARKRFEAARPEPGSLIALAAVSGVSGPAGEPCIAAYEVAGSIPPAEVEPFMQKVRAACRKPFGPDTDWLFNADISFLASFPGYENGSKACSRILGCPTIWASVEHEAEAHLASCQPDEGIVRVHEDGEKALLAHHGGYLFWESDTNGTDAAWMSIRSLPDAAGTYYFTGKSWSAVYQTDWGDEHDAGFDVDECVPATEEHCARFGLTMSGLDERAEDLMGEPASEAPAAQPGV